MRKVVLISLAGMLLAVSCSPLNKIAHVDVKYLNLGDFELRDFDLPELVNIPRYSVTLDRESFQNSYDRRLLVLDSVFIPDYNTGEFLGEKDTLVKDLTLPIRFDTLIVQYGTERKAFLNVEARVSEINRTKFLSRDPVQGLEVEFEKENQLNLLVERLDSLEEIMNDIINSIEEYPKYKFNVVNSHAHDEAVLYQKRLMEIQRRYRNSLEYTTLEDITKLQIEASDFFLDLTRFKALLADDAPFDLEVNDTLIFRSGEYEIDHRQVAVLNSYINELNRMIDESEGSITVFVSVNGFADNMVIGSELKSELLSIHNINEGPILPGDEHAMLNKLLSQSRAETVLSYLTSELGSKLKLMDESNLLKVDAIGNGLKLPKPGIICADNCPERRVVIISSYVQERTLDYIQE